MQLRLALAASVLLITPEHHRHCDDYPDYSTRRELLTSTSPPLLPSEPIVLDTSQSYLHDVWTIQRRRVDNILAAAQSPDRISSWLISLGSNGRWPDSEVDYSTGCAARRANWPAQVHWQRLTDMARAWRGLPGEEHHYHNTTLRTAISNGMNYWFGRDLENLACLDTGGSADCPCENRENSLWNTNWFSNLILVPSFVSQTCLLLNDTLSDFELGNCTRITDRSYAAFGRTLHGIGALTGANALDIAKIGIDQGLLTANVSLLADAYERAHKELQIMNGTHADGIRADGSFGQHNGLIYNGNYGKDFTNDILGLEIGAAGTAYEAPSNSKRALETLFEGDQWMIYRNTITGTLHWDLSALPRFISFPVIDGQATTNIKLNLTDVRKLGELWSSNTLVNFAKNLTEINATPNAGDLVGNRMFYANDYMVHRGSNYVTTLKMYSSRTKNTECTNSQNPLGFHLADGTLYNHIQGDEYEDISAAWDWNRIPGITTDYGATPLACNTTSRVGLESFVGGVSTGRIGAAAMRYTNPLTKALHWQKAWFFLEDDTQLVMVAGLKSTTNASVNSVLDQRRSGSDILLDGVLYEESKVKDSDFSTARTLWHGNVGYVLPTDRDSPFRLNIDARSKTGNWSTIGTSTQPPTTVDLFTAWIEHPRQSNSSALSYSIFPGTSPELFLLKSTSRHVRILQNDDRISAVYDEDHKTAMCIFWDTSGGQLALESGSGEADILIEANANAALIYRLATGEVTVSDPSQSLKSVELTMTVGQGIPPLSWGEQPTKKLVIGLPSGGLVGSSVTQIIR